MKATFTTLLLFLYISFISINAQKKWTLEECYLYALENNIQLKRQALLTDVAKNDLKQSKMQLLPGLDASAQHNYKVNGFSQDYSWSGNSFQDGSVEIRSDLNLFNGFRDVNYIKYNELNLQVNLANLEKAKNDLALNIAATYLQVLYNKELLAVTQSQMEVTQMEVEKYTKLVEVGNVARGSLFEIQAQAALDKVNMTTAQNNLNLSLINLAQMLDFDSVSNFDVAEPQELPMSELVLPDSIEFIYNQAVSLMPEIKSADLQMKRSDKFLSIEKGMIAPKLNLFGSYGSYYTEKATSSYINQIDDNQNMMLGLNLSIPIFTKWSNRTRISNAKIGYLDAKFNYDQTMQVLYKEIQQAHADAKAAFQNFNSRNEAVVASEENYKYNQQKFEVGIINSVDYNIAKNNYTKAQSDLLQSKYQYLFKMKILDFYMGKPIKL